MFLDEVAEILGLDGGNHSGVGKRRVAPREAHAVDHHLVVFRGGRDDPAARAHAERVHSAVANLGGEAVAGGGQQARTAGTGREVVLRAVDERLGVLDAEPDREGFLFQQDVFRGEQPVDVPCGVPGGEDHGVGADFPAGGGDHAADVFFMDDEIRHLGLEPHLPAGCEDRCPDRLDHIGQQVRSDVRMSVG